MTWAMARYPLARTEGLSVFFKSGLGWPQVGLASIVAIAVSVLLLDWMGVLLLGVTWLITTLMARLAMARLSGLTGDVYGAICEVVEVVLLILIIITVRKIGMGG
jgi:adenosylcobinamide-GDP ribazoletransferase